MEHFVPYNNHRVIERSLVIFKKSGHKIFESLQLEHAREKQRTDAKKILVGKYIKVAGPGPVSALYKVTSVKEGGAGAETFFTLLVVSGEQFRVCVRHGGDTSLLATTEIPVRYETEIWVETNH